MSDLHRALGVAAILVALVTTLSAGLLAARPAAASRADGRILLDRLIVAELGVVAVAILLGLGVAIGGPGPADPLHYLYAIVALLTLPIGRAMGRRGRGQSRGAGRRTAGWVALSGLVLLGVLVRLFMTGR